MHDLVIDNARIIDGLGGPGREGAVAVSKGRIVAVGPDPGIARQRLDAEGLVLAPGIVDIHTHYDAQLTWDPFATPSTALGVTTVVMGNCGFTIAPCRPQHRDLTMRHLTHVEGMSLEVLRRARLDGYQGGKSALYALVSSLRPRPVRPMVRFEGLPGEFSQHDFGEVDVRFLDGSERRVHFFASRLKYSRWAQVSLVEHERVEALVRALVDHFEAMGGCPLVAVFDRPKTVALAWRRDGVVTEWNPTFAGVVLDLGIGIEVCPAEGCDREPGRMGEGLLLQAAALPRRGGPAAAAQRVARGGEHAATLACHRRAARSTHA